MFDLFEKIKQFDICQAMRALLCTCIACDAKPIRGNPFLCGDCSLLLPNWQGVHCIQCGLFLAAENASDIKCGACLTKPPNFDFFYALFPFEFPINHFVYELKSHGRLIFANFFAEYFFNQIPIWYAQDDLPDVLIPMPLHPKRLAARGFNQAGEIAKILSRRLSIPYEFRQIKKIMYTRDQRRLNKSARSRNVRGAFYTAKNFVGQHCAVIDDVVASGHTVHSLSRTLKAAGAKRIDIWCCARASLKLK